MMKKRVNYNEALRVALRLEALLKPSCERIEIAGSIRRRWPTVGDIEIVAIPRKRIQQSLLGPVEEKETYLDLHLRTYPDDYRILKSGERMKKLMFEGMPVDLFLTDPARWGVIYTLRTGSTDFSKWLVTSRNKGGARRVDRVIKEGRVWPVGKSDPLNTPEETDVFLALGVPWTPLEMRHKGWWNVDMTTWNPVEEMEPKYG